MLKSSARRVVYTYWVNASNLDIPIYLKMCLKTWQKNIPELEIIVINHSNVLEFVGDDLDMNNFLKLSLAQQSDVVSVATLYKRGGVFMDIDTILTGDVSELIFKQQGSRLSVFGYPKEKAIHLAVMWCHETGNELLGEWYAQICEKLKSTPEVIPWDYVGNSIVNELLKSEYYSNKYEIIDRTLSGNIMESVFDDDSNAHNAYLIFWFGEEVTEPEEILSKAVCNIISLHNSWTPERYKTLTLGELIGTNVTLSKFFCHILKSND